MTIQSLAHVCLKATDLAATETFYCEALGLTKFFNFTRKGKVIGFYLKAANETFVEVFAAEEVTAVGKSVLTHFCLQVGDIRALRAALVEKGYAPRELKMGADGSIQFWMRDPGGMELEFQEYTEKSSQRTGQDVEVNW